MTDITEKEMLTVQDLSDLFRIHPLTVRKLCVQGELPAVKIGRQWRTDPDVLDCWIVIRVASNQARARHRLPEVRT